VDVAERRLGRRIIGLVVLIAIIAGGFVAWKLFFAPREVPANLILLSGRIEGDDSAVAAKTAGRILEMRVSEGDSVKAGDVIAMLDDQQIRAREDQARAAVLAAESRVRTARDQIAVLQEQFRQTQLQSEQAKVDAQGRVRQAEAETAAAEAEMAWQEAAYQQALFDKEAYTRLAKTGAVSERQGKQAATTADQQEAAVAASKRRVEAAREAANAARAALVNPQIREAQGAAIRKQMAQQESEVGTAAAQSEQARAQLAEAEANRQDLVIKAPFAGTVMTRSAQPGEVVTPGMAVITLLDLGKVYLRGFVPEGEIGKIKVGQPARVYLDSNPEQPLDAHVSRIDPQATFTPENTYFRDERVKQVVGVKLLLKAESGYAKPGMPADGEILTSGDRWPAGRWRK
jgi:HlyD family secretion protein